MDFIPMITPPLFQACHVLLLRMLTHDSIEHIFQHTKSTSLQQHVFTYTYIRHPWKLSKQDKTTLTQQLREGHHVCNQHELHEYIERYCQRQITLYMLHPDTRTPLTLEELYDIQQRIKLYTTQLLCGISALLTYSTSHIIVCDPTTLIQYTHLCMQHRIAQYRRIELCADALLILSHIHAHVSWKTPIQSVQWDVIQPVFAITNTYQSYQIALKWGSQFIGANGHIQYRKFPDIIQECNDKRNTFMWKLMVYFLLCRQRKHLNIFDIFIVLFGVSQIEHANTHRTIRLRLFRYFYTALASIQPYMHITYTFTPEVYTIGFERRRYQKGSWAFLRSATLSVNTVDKSV